MKTQIIFVMLMLLIPFLGYSTAYNNTSSGEWTAASWNPSTPPTDGTGHTVTIGTNSIYLNTALSNWTDITINSSAALIVSDVSNSTITVGNTGELQIRAGAVIDANTAITVESGGVLTIGKDVTILGSVLINDGGVLTDMLTSTSVGKSFFTENGSSFTLNGGSFEYNNSDGTTPLKIEGSSGADVFRIENGGSFIFNNTDAVNHGSIQFIADLSKIQFATTSTFSVQNASVEHVTTYNTLVIDGQLSVNNGDYSINNGSIDINAAADCSTEGALIIRDTDISDDGRTSLTDNGATNYGILYTGNGVSINVDGLLMAEEISATLGGGGANVSNNERVFVKRFLAGTAGGNTLNSTSNVICASNEITPPGYAGSYLFYCTDDGDLTFVDNDGTMFYSSENGDPSAILNAGSTGATVSYYSSNADCYSDFYELSSSTLPIELKDFYAVQVKDEVEIRWITSSEKNSEMYTLQKSADGISYTSIAKLNAAGNSNTDKSYVYVDKTPLAGLTYYKLLQYDIDGSVADLGAVTVVYSRPTFKMYSNVITDGNIRIRFESNINNYISIMNIRGEVIYNEQVNDTEFQIKLNIPSGEYYIQNISGTRSWVEKIIVK